MNVALDRGDYDLALGAKLVAVLLFRIDVWDKLGDRLLHHAGALDDLRKEHPAGPEEVTHNVHPCHKRAFYDVQGTLRSLPRLLHVGLDVGVYAVDQRVLQTLVHRQ